MSSILERSAACTFIVAAGLSSVLAARADDGLDAAVATKLESWRDLKFGFMAHWGPYSQWGAVESWSLCSEDESWCRRPPGAYDEYKRRYEELKLTFNASRFAPEHWARAARDAGMRYVVFTTKHHDGFCMFDTAETDYRVTDLACPMHARPNGNVTRAVFDAFRAESFMIGAYFSKPDWHHDDYWAPEWATPDRNVNYDPSRYPARWERFKRFTFRQIEELMTGYGPVDILWLDGGWVRPLDTVGKDVAAWAGGHGYDQDIDMPRIAAMARSHQPGLIVVDRTVHGAFENYRTPEQHVPDAPLDGPWETCMTMAQQWSYRPDDVYKPARELVHLLVDVVAKGGNLLLNVGPRPDGELPDEAYQRLAEIGVWMKVNGDSIYGTRPLAPYKEFKTCLTVRPDGRCFAIYLADANETAPPRYMIVHSHRPTEPGEVRMLGVADPLDWEPVGNGMLVRIPRSVVAAPPCDHAWTLWWREEPH